MKQFSLGAQEAYKQIIKARGPKQYSEYFIFTYIMLTFIYSKEPYKQGRDSLVNHSVAMPD